MKTRQTTVTADSSKVQQRNVHLISSLSELCQQTRDIFRLAKKKIQLYTHDLDPRVLNHSEIERYLTCFIRSSRNVRVEILIFDEQNLQGTDHRLVRLAQKYTSYVSIRVIPKDLHVYHFTFSLVDERTLIYRNMADRFVSEFHQLPSSKIKQKAKYFNEVWQQSLPAIYLRALHL